MLLMQPAVTQLVALMQRLSWVQSFSCHFSLGLRLQHVRYIFHFLNSVQSGCHQPPKLPTLLYFMLSHKRHDSKHADEL